MHCYALVLPYVGRLDVFPYYGPLCSPGSSWDWSQGELEVIIQNRWHVLWTPRKRGEAAPNRGIKNNVDHKPGEPGTAHA